MSVTIRSAQQILGGNLVRSKAARQKSRLSSSGPLPLMGMSSEEYEALKEQWEVLMPCGKKGKKKKGKGKKK